MNHSTGWSYIYDTNIYVQVIEQLCFQRKKPANIVSENANKDFFQFLFLFLFSFYKKLFLNFPLINVSIIDQYVNWCSDYQSSTELLLYNWSDVECGRVITTFGIDF